MLHELGQDSYIIVARAWTVERVQGILTRSSVLATFSACAKETKEQARYDEIRASVKGAVEWYISARYPYCSIASGFKETTGPSSGHNSLHLINQGYIKKDELLDIDNTSYCDVYVKINPEYDDPYNHQKNCRIYYKIYLKCKNYEDKGYINWGY